MNNSHMLQFILGGLSGFGTFLILRLAFKNTTIQVEDETAAMVTCHGKLVQTIREPGLHMIWNRWLPWVNTIQISLQRDFRHYLDIHVNDCTGTTVIIDLWIEFRIVDPEKAIFHVEGWEQSLQSLLTHSATSILCTQEFEKILCNRNELGHILQKDIQSDTQRWGLKVEMVMIKKVSLLPDVSKQMFATVAARLERAKADVEEEGRLKASLLEAKTSSDVASLVAEAKGQYPAAVGRAFAKIRKTPKIFEAYQELYALSQVRPHRMVSFHGFEGEGLREIDAAMVAPAIGESSSFKQEGVQPGILPLSAVADTPLKST